MKFRLISALVVGMLTIAPTVLAKEWTVQMGANNGRLVYEPKELTIAKGDTVVWTMGKAGPHNVVFDKGPAGVDVKAISHPKLVNKTDPSFKTTFTTVGEYKYYCKPHKGAGMVAEIYVK